jgi:hypothetical protein
MKAQPQPTQRIQAMKERKQQLCPQSIKTYQYSPFVTYSRLPRKPADNKYFRCLCDDGVFRILTWLPTPPDQPTGIAVYDALPLSPFYIKAYLDRHEWSQKKEDTFRGVDGRRVPTGVSNNDDRNQQVD